MDPRKEEHRCKNSLRCIHVSLFSRTDYFKVETSAPIVTELKQVRVWHDEKGLGDDWYLNQVYLTPPLLRGQTI